MTAQWTIDNDDGWLCRDGDPVVQLGKGDQSGLLDALNDGVRAARLVDDMAAVIRRLLDQWEPVPEDDPNTWQQITYSHIGSPPERAIESMVSGEVAALHHARRQEVQPDAYSAEGRRAAQDRHVDDFMRRAENARQQEET